MIKIKEKLIFIFLFIFLLNPIYSQYLGDLEFDIQDDGHVLISGDTDYPNFLISETDILTSKNKENWLFELKTPIFENYYCAILLPKNIQINYINSPNPVRITNKDNRIQIISTGQDQNIQIKIQYKKNNFKETYNYFWFGLIFGIIVTVCFLVLFFKNKKRRNNKEPEQVTDTLLEELSDRQKEIIDILNSKKIVTQHYLLKELKMPKSSLSRNLKSLETKEIIEIKRYGITNKILLKNK